ncbi:MAG: hypothetical protein NTW97_11185 [Candidatus Krumholzibacteria bacterium]|nr:hypothetical protein [Candidatus Krumholzibacteria bacterium]
MRFSRAFGISLALLVVLLLAGGSTSAQEGRKRQAIPDADIDEEPLKVFRNIEKAWQSGNAQALAGLLSESRIFMEIRGIDRRGGYFTKPQVLYIFKDLFVDTKQTAFTFVKFHNLEKQDSRIYGMALRSYKINQSGGLYKDKVYVTLVKEGSRWAVAEIKSTW